MKRFFLDYLEFLRKRGRWFLLAVAFFSLLLVAYLILNRHRLPLPFLYALY